jgi:predicted nucleic acid-binding protein
MLMASKSSPVKSLNTQSNARSDRAPSIHQLSLWDLLAEATRVPLDAQLWMLFEDLDEAIDGLPIEQQISVAGEGLARVGEIVGLRAESYL